MADANTVKFTTPFGEVIAQGIQVITLIAMIALGWYIIDYTKEALCLMRLNVWIAAQRDEQKTALQLPAELWRCVPEFVQKKG